MAEKRKEDRKNLIGFYTRLRSAHEDQNLAGVHRRPERAGSHGHQREIHGT